jgi:hypothetical protein
MSEYNENVTKLLAVLRKKPFLFPKNMRKTQPSLYFEYFEDINKKPFFQMPAMAHFNVDILDQYEKHVVWTGFIPADSRGSFALHTLVQVNKENHIIFLYTNDDNKPTVIATLYITDAQDFLAFISENEKHIAKDKEEVGFAIKPGFGS